MFHTFSMLLDEGRVTHAFIELIHQPGKTSPESCVRTESTSDHMSGAGHLPSRNRLTEGT